MLIRIYNMRILFYIIFLHREARTNNTATHTIVYSRLAFADQAD